MSLLLPTSSLGACDKFLVTICAADQLRVTNNCTSTPEVRQKTVSIQLGPEETHWTLQQLVDIGCFLHDADGFRTERFRKHAGLITYLGWTLWHRSGDRQAVAKAILALMHVWVTICQDDANCIVPPSTTQMQDPHSQKVMNLYEKLQFALLQAETDKALAQSGTGVLTPLQRDLIDWQKQSLTQRVL